MIYINDMRYFAHGRGQKSEYIIMFYVTLLLWRIELHF